ncbi:hypothetical protein B0J11DRAFT_335969 [Dendryphion nanum]|uniref:Uncharacterized protein n=1 Tax=Dendryphion nanum TaxID=256645 RepID=A0A9P9IK35_9PLEO|nr:hypothetical protein B0J11DRAFT_335969 [Dendryphion nanum]
MPPSPKTKTKLIHALAGDNLPPSCIDISASTRWHPMHIVYQCTASASTSNRSLARSRDVFWKVQRKKTSGVTGHVMQYFVTNAYRNPARSRLEAHKPTYQSHEKPRSRDMPTHGPVRVRSAIHCNTALFLPILSCPILAIRRACEPAHILVRYIISCTVDTYMRLSLPLTLPDQSTCAGKYPGNQAGIFCPNDVQSCSIIRGNGNRAIGKSIQKSKSISAVNGDCAVGRYIRADFCSVVIGDVKWSLEGIDLGGGDVVAMSNRMHIPTHMPYRFIVVHRFHAE